MPQSSNGAKTESRFPLPASEIRERETGWLDHEGVTRILKVTQQQLEILKLTLRQKDRFGVVDLARELQSRQDFSVCVKLLEKRGLVKLRRVAAGKQKPFVAEPGAVLKAAAEVSLD